MLNFGEIFDIVIMSAVVGYIFSDMIGRFRRPVNYDPLIHNKPGFDIQNFKFAIYATAPAIILHELGHKFVALAYGLNATFHAAYMWLGVGVILKLLNFGFIFFVPAYVSIIGSATPFQYAIIAFAGPGVNLILWLGSKFALSQKMVERKYIPLLVLTSRINMFLFIFNMLPIGMFDGYKVFSGLYQAFF